MQSGSDRRVKRALIHYPIHVHASGSASEIILLHEHCDELHFLQLTKITILQLERCLVFVVVRQLLIHLMSRAMQIVWGHVLVVHHHHTLSTSSCFANSRHIRRDIAFCQSMHCQQIWHDSSVVLHYDVHVNDRVYHELASIVIYTLADKLFVRAWI